jgi:hypothetical protein
VLELLRREAEFQRRVGQHYEHGGGSGGGGVKELFRRATTQREMARDFDAARANAPVQTRMVTIEMTLVVVPPHLPHKEEVMSDLPLPSRSTSSHTTPKMKTTASRHRQEF